MQPDSAVVVARAAKSRIILFDDARTCRADNPGCVDQVGGRVGDSTGWEFLFSRGSLRTERAVPVSCCGTGPSRYKLPYEPPGARILASVEVRDL